MDDNKELNFEDKMIVLKDLHEKIKIMRKYWKSLKNQM